MSYTNGYQTVQQSMNGVITISDGQGTVIENGVITTTAITLNNLIASVTTATCGLWQNLVGTQAITLGTATNPLRTPYNASGTTDVVNYITMFNYVATRVTDLLSSSNTWIGIYNKFSGYISTDFIYCYTTSGEKRLFTDATSNAIINIGTTNTATVNVCDVSISKSGTTLNMNPNTNCNTWNIGTSATTQNIMNIGTYASGGTNQIGNTTNTNVVGLIKTVGSNITHNTGGDIGIGQNSGTSNGVFIGNSTNLNSIGGFNVNKNGVSLGSACANIDTSSVGADMTIGYSNTKNIWIGNTAQTGGVCTIKSFVLSLTSLTGTGGDFFFRLGTAFQNLNSQLGTSSIQFASNTTVGKKEIDVVVTSGTVSGGGGLYLYTNDNTSLITNTVSLLMSIYRGEGLQILTGGICFDKGNLTKANSNTGYFIQTGTATMPNNVNSNTRKELTVTFPVAFSAIPNVVATNAYYNASLTNANKGLVSVGNITVSTFVLMIYNISPTDITVDIPVNWTAIGKY
jgi:hypothetical protein